MIDISLDDKQLRNLLVGLHSVSKGIMLEQSSKAGNIAREAVRREFKKSTTEWTQAYEKDKNGNTRRVLRKGSIAGGNFVMEKTNFQLGKRIKHRRKGGLDNPPSMANFITSYTHETTGTTVVGGKHKSFTPNKMKDGEIVGTLPRVGAVSKQTIAILEKLNFGHLQGKHSEYLRWKKGKKSIEQFDGTWKKRNFFEKGWSAARGTVITTMTNELQKHIAQKANNTDLSKVKKEKYAV
jgi:hypothetical protein